MHSFRLTPSVVRAARFLCGVWLCCSSSALAQVVGFTPGTRPTLINTAPTAGLLIFTFPQAAWYLISVPLDVDDNSVATLFPMARGAYAWENGQYVSVSTIQNDRGYWLLVSAPSTAVISGTPRHRLSGHFLPGWQLIGSVLDTVNFASPNDTPDGSIMLPLFRWHGERQRYYPTANTIALGFGHWMAVLQESDVLIEGSTSNHAAKAADASAISMFFEQYGTEPPAPPFHLFQDWSTPVPTAPALLTNYPNPFNPETTIRYVIAKEGLVRLCVYNRLAQQIRILVAHEHQPGNYETVWDGRDDRGREVASGVYFYKIVTSDFSETRKMVLLQ